MSAGVEAIALCSPIVAANAVFSVRRASRGADAITDNPIYGAMNMDIAAAQTLKGVKAARDAAIASNTDAKFVAEGASEAIKNLSKTNKFINGVGKVIDFTAKNINPIICATSAANVLFGADDKVDAGARETIALATMFGAEKSIKPILGKPYTNKEALYKSNPFLKAQAEAINDYCSTKKLFNNKLSLKFVPGALKGLTFVSASIAGYKFGSYLGDCILGKKETAKQCA